MTAELMKKVKNAILDNRLVGNASFSDEEYENLLEYIRGFSLTYVSGQNSRLYGDYVIHFVALVEIAKRWKKIDDDESDESGFWAFVFKTIGIDEYNPKLYKEYADLIIELGWTNNILIANTAKKYWATLMMHAFAPISSIYAFLDLSYNIYRKDLDFNYTEDDKGVCELATIRFCEILQSSVGNDKTVSIGSNTYNVKIGLRTLAMNDATQNEFVALLDKTLETINKLFHEQSFKPKSYFESLICDWWQSKLAEIVIDRKTGRSSMLAVSKQSITAKFIRDDDEVNLVIPPIRLNICAASTVLLTVYAGDNYEMRVSEQLFTKIGELTITTKQKEIDLNTLFQGNEVVKIRVEITENGIIIFDKKIDKEFILFDGENEVLSQINKTNNYFVYARDIDALKTPADISTHASNLYNIYPKDSETLSGVVQRVFFVDKTGMESNKDAVCLIGELFDCEWRLGDIGCAVFSEQVSLLLTDEIAVNGLVLTVDTKRILLSNITSRQEDGYLFFDITDYISKSEPSEVSVYSHLKGKPLMCKNIVVFPTLSIALSKAAFYENGEKKLTISVNGESRVFSWDNTQTEVVYPLNDGDLIIKVPYTRWRVDDKSWCNEPFNKKLWYKKHFHNGSLLEIDSAVDMGNATLLSVIDGQLTNGQSEIVERNKVNGKFEIGKYIFSHEHKQKIMFLLKSNKGARPVELFIVATEEYFEYSPIGIYENRVMFLGDNDFIGADGRKFTIEFRCVGKEPITVESNSLVGGMISDIDEGIYWVRVLSKDGGLFTKQEKVFWQGEFVFGDKDKLKLSDIVLNISPICGIGVISDFWKTSKAGYRISKLARAKSDADTYIGKIYYIDKAKCKKNVGGVSSCKVEIISPSALRILVADNSGGYTQKLTFDASSKCIREPNAPTLFSITNYNFLEVKDV
ncbi:MAG: hypothetical protein LBT20_01360 [Clostridiales bacterium]|jgi:hypothetical protein|nr:hypothetical protein [Clostridiales bacterium]